MTVMTLSRTNPDDLLLDHDIWDVPAQLSDEDLYTHAGARLGDADPAWPETDQ